MNTGGPQGQCGTGEIYSIFNKKMTLPENIETNHPLKAIRNNFVDDSSDPITAHNDDIEEIERQIDEKMITDNLECGLVNNLEKKEKMIIDPSRPTETKKLVGIMINSKLDSNSEIEAITKKAEKIISCVRACSILTKSQKITIARLQIHSVLGTLPFIYAYATKTNFEKFRKKIVLIFKKSDIFEPAYSDRIYRKLFVWM